MKKNPLFPIMNCMEFTQVIGFFSVAAAFFYLFVHLCLLTGMERKKNHKNSAQPFVSVIVAARDEQNSMRDLLGCLLSQTFRNYEIIIVNDRSTDGTAEIIESIRKNNPIVKRIDITASAPDMPSKKNALRAGINSSRGELLCFTDADCFPPPTWVEELVGQFEPGVGLVAGYSPYQIPRAENSAGFGRFFKNLFFTFIAYEEFRAAIWAAGSIGLNLGWLCTGRNLAYRRTVYDEVGGFEKIKMSISGDDDLFLQLVRRSTAWKIRYATEQGSFVPTKPPPSFRAFIEQRKRHFSAAKYFSSSMKLFFFLYHSANLLLASTFILFLLQYMSLPLFFICFFGKLVLDSMLVIPSAGIFGTYQFLPVYAVMEALYVFYNSLIGPLGLFRRFEWKPN